MNTLLTLEPNQLETLDQVGRWIINQINTLAQRENNNQVMKFWWHLAYNDSVRNTHRCPKNGVTNWDRVAGVPVGYPGWQGNVNIIYKKEPKFSASTLFASSLSHTGTGGYAGRNEYSWDYKIFADDFPQANRDVLIHRAMCAINGTAHGISTHTYEWTAPA